MLASEQLSAVQSWLNATIVGQPHLVNRLLIALLADGHLLVEGAPGLAKTKAIKTLSDCVEASFHRVQFTPDLLPSDVTGTDIYRPETGAFEFQQGPIFHNLVLADEINRAPAKVQSALLEAMAERQVSVGQKSYDLSEIFLVMATQNPVEQEGTYPLPEAQLDRFLMHVNVDYPSAEAELAILRLARAEARNQDEQAPAKISQAQLLEMRAATLALHMSEPVESYIVALTCATRNARRYSDQIASAIDYGVSPRASIALERCARANAWLAGRDFVSPEDVQAVVHDVFRHRLVLSFEAEANGITADKVIDQLLQQVAVG
jgi:MoxR-like ATPase